MTGGAILLAAGYSRRFGSDKRCHVLADDTPLLIASTRLYGGVFPHLLVVLRPDDHELMAAVRRERTAADVEVVPCPEARHGMGHSLACGARAAVAWDYAFVALADMAWIEARTLTRLIAEMEDATSDAVVQPVHGGTPGHPVGFAGRYLPRLAALTGDTGARDVVRDAGAALIRVAVDDPGVLQDLDTPP